MNSNFTFHNYHHYNGNEISAEKSCKVLILHKCVCVCVCVGKLHVIRKYVISDSISFWLFWPHKSSFFRLQYWKLQEF